jgi:hypothetical protein
MQQQHSVLHGCWMRVIPIVWALPSQIHLPMHSLLHIHLWMRKQLVPGPTGTHNRVTEQFRAWPTHTRRCHAGAQERWHRSTVKKLHFLMAREQLCCTPKNQRVFILRRAANAINTL